MEKFNDFMENIKSKIIIIKKHHCVDCVKLVDLFESIHLDQKYYSTFYIEDSEDDDLVDYLRREFKSYPMVFVNKKYIGNYKDIKTSVAFGLFSDILKNELDIDIDIDV